LFGVMGIMGVEQDVGLKGGMGLEKRMGRIHQRRDRRKKDLVKESKAQRDGTTREKGCL